MCGDHRRLHAGRDPRAHREGRRDREDLSPPRAGRARARAPRRVSDILLCPTGGVSRHNMEAYFAAGAALVGVGNDILDRKALEAGDDTRGDRARAALPEPRSHPGEAFRATREGDRRPRIGEPMVEFNQTHPGGRSTCRVSGGNVERDHRSGPLGARTAYVSRVGMTPSAACSSISGRRRAWTPAAWRSIRWRPRAPTS